MQIIMNVWIVIISVFSNILLLLFLCFFVVVVGFEWKSICAFYNNINTNNWLESRRRVAVFKLKIWGIIRVVRYGL